MIIDQKRFVEEERPYWMELEGLLKRFEDDAAFRLSLEEIKRFHYLYERTSAGLGKLATFAVAPETHAYLENLVARAYGQVHDLRERPHRLAPVHWFLKTFPATFRRHARFFLVSCATMLLGCAAGALILAMNPQDKQVVLPFDHLLQDPSERVRKEESAGADSPDAGHAAFSSFLMTHNTRVAITTLALGMTYGVGTVISLFYNGVILGAVAWDYVLDGQTAFLLGWLMPHGVVEIPAILIAGQAGLLLASGLMGWGSRASLRQRMKAIGGDLVTLIGGVACLLVWAGIIEAFLSQYHEPAIPYGVKILFGTVELVLLAGLLMVSGKRAGAE